METLLTKIPSIDNMTRYYSNGDLADLDFLKNILNNLDEIELNLNNIDYDCINLENLYFYFWCCNFEKLFEDLNRFNLNEKEKNRIKNVNLQISIEPKNIIKYINKNYNIVFDKTKHRKRKWHAISYDLFEFCYNKYSNGVKPEVFRYIETNLYYDVLVNFDICSSYYQKNKDNFKNLFINLKKTNVFDDFIYTTFLEKISNTEDSFLKEKAEYLCIRGLLKLKEMNIYNTEIVYAAKQHFDRYYTLARKFKLPIANDFYSFSITINMELNEYIMKHGHEFKGEPVELTQLINIMKESKEVFKFVNLTHYSENGAIKNICHYENNNLNSLSIVFNELGNLISDKYPYWKQSMMNLTNDLYSKLLSIYINDDKLSNDIYAYLINICKLLENNYFKVELNLVDEILGIFEIIININRLYKEDNKGYLLKALENSCSYSLCAVIEKILRNILFAQNYDNCYIDVESITLASILKELSKNNFMSYDILNYLEYFLIKENNQDLLKHMRPGKNIRNIQMHDHNDKYLKTNYGTVLQLFFMLILILNEISIKIKSV